jgi:uncharacterized membrane protein
MRLFLRKMTYTNLIVLTLSGSVLTITPVVNAAAAITQPEYAKWGQLAVQHTTARYHAAIIDYLHVGRHEVRPDVAEEKFKLWLRDEQKREFGVFITIQFYVANDKVISVRFKEIK